LFYKLATKAGIIVDKDEEDPFCEGFEIDYIRVTSDPEHHYIYLCLFSNYYEKEYSESEVDFAELSEFRKRIIEWQEEGVVPKEAKFGVHTYY